MARVGPQRHRKQKQKQYIPSIHNCIYQYSDIYLYIHSDHIMATCFDRKTVIIRETQNIFKVQQSEDSSAHFVVP